MKPKYYNIIFLVATLFVLLSFGDPYLKKRITDKNFKYEFYTTDKKVKPKNDVTYYWFKGGVIHNSNEGIAGELLDDQFDKFYLNNQLAERGKFKNGKKVGLWKTWYVNGTVSSEQEWAGGMRNGNYKTYDENGSLIEKGLYRANKKQGKWINYIQKDTLKYRNDKLIIKKEAKTKAQKEVVNQEKVLEKQNEKEANKIIKTNSSNKNEQQNNSNVKSNKQGFFKRLFSKKEKSKTNNVKGS